MSPFALPDPPLVDDEVRLRPWCPEDAEALAQAWADPDVARWTSPPSDPSTEAARHWIAGELARRERGLALDLAVERLDGAGVVGEVGLTRLDVPRGLVEVGWWTAAAHRGRHVASRAVSLLVDWALAELSVEMAYARLDPANAASVGVARAAGFELRGSASDGLEVWSRR